jgi:hypothetical protein
VTRPPRPPHRVFWPFTHATAQKGTPASPIHTVTLAHVETLPPPGQCCGACQRCVRALACDGARSNTNSPLGARKSTERPDISHSCLQPHHCALRLPRPSSHTHTQHMGNCDFSCVPCHAAPHFQAHTPCRPRHGSPLTFFSPIFLIIATICTRAAVQPRTTACFLVLSSVVFEREHGIFDGRHKIRREPAARSLLLQSSRVWSCVLAS